MNFMAFKKYILLLSAVAGLTFSSCQKDDEEPTPEPTKKELLSNKWKVSDIQTSTGQSIIDLVPQTQCLKDNTITLVADNTFTLEEGANVCDTPFEGSGTWSLIENETKLKLVISGSESACLRNVKRGRQTLCCDHETSSCNKWLATRSDGA